MGFVGVSLGVRAVGVSLNLNRFSAGGPFFPSRSGSGRGAVGDERRRRRPRNTLPLVSCLSSMNHVPVSSLALKAALEAALEAAIPSVPYGFTRNNAGNRVRLSTFVNDANFEREVTPPFQLCRQTKRTSRFRWEPISLS